MHYQAIPANLPGQTLVEFPANVRQDFIVTRENLAIFFPQLAVFRGYLEGANLFPCTFEDMLDTSIFFPNNPGLVETVWDGDRPARFTYNVWGTVSYLNDGSHDTAPANLLIERTFRFVGNVLSYRDIVTRAYSNKGEDLVPGENFSLGKVVSIYTPSATVAKLGEMVIDIVVLANGQELYVNHLENDYVAYRSYRNGIRTIVSCVREHYWKPTVTVTDRKLYHYLRRNSGVDVYLESDSYLTSEGYNVAKKDVTFPVEGSHVSIKADTSFNTDFPAPPMMNMGIYIRNDEGLVTAFYKVGWGITRDLKPKWTATYTQGTERKVMEVTSGKFKGMQILLPRR